MPNYAQILQHLALVPPEASAIEFARLVTPYLIDAWLDDYAVRWKSDEIVETQVSGFSYLFDISTGRLISAWGVSEGRSAEKRDKSRMAGHPLSAGPFYHRGHAIPHTLGGTTDINLVPQLGSINVGAFRPLEKRAVATPGSLYFTYWLYSKQRLSDSKISQTPVGVDQGLLIRGSPPMITTHRN